MYDRLKGSRAQKRFCRANVEFNASIGPVHRISTRASASFTSYQKRDFKTLYVFYLFTWKFLGRILLRERIFFQDLLAGTEIRRELVL